jgi:valyl-tRNA synthetase
MLTPASFWILAKYYELENKLAESSTNYELAHSVDAIYRFLWDYYADWYVEYLKVDANQIPFAKSLFKQFIITVSPYCPFETEALWQNFFGEKTLLANEAKDFEWTKKAFSIHFETNNLIDLEKDSRFQEFQILVDFVQNLRSTRGLFAIDPANLIQIYTLDKNLLKYADFVKLIAKTELLEESKPELYSVKNDFISYSIDILAYIKDKQTEIARTNKIIADLQKQITVQESKLNNPKFVENAEQEVIVETKEAIVKRNVELQEQKAKLDFLER